MKRGLILLMLFTVAAAGAAPAFAQAPRQDIIWARQTTSAITLDGKLDEADWAKAESTIVVFGTDNGIPGSGWKIEGGTLPNDSTYAVLKFLVKDNQLYLGAELKDRSIGGSKDFNRFDGLLMNIPDHSIAGAPKPPAEYLYSWWYPNEDSTGAPGQLPSFKGSWAPDSVGAPRDSTQIANWDAVTIVHGLSNSDAVPDTGYTVEMRFNLTPMGYDVMQPGGGIIEWSISIYDCDWLWPLDVFHLSYNRVWWQNPWGNTYWYDLVHVYSRPSVTVNSGAVPYVGPEYYVPDGNAYAAPTIDGQLNEPIWSQIQGFDIRYDDDVLRQSYPSIGPYRSGQYQAPVNGRTDAVLDPGDATVKMFFQDSTLYMGFDVRDQAVQYVSNFDRWDGFLVTLNDRTLRNPDNVLMPRRLSFQVGPTGNALSSDYLATLVNEGGAEVAIHLNAGTSVDTLGASADNGYTAELKIHLTRLGYPPDLGDGSLFIGMCLLDGDTFNSLSIATGTRTWWFRQYEGECCAAWAYLASGTSVTGVPDRPIPVTQRYNLLGSFPNPASRTTIQYSLGAPSAVNLEIFDVSGRLVTTRDLGVQDAGVRNAAYDGSGNAAGVYLYRLKVSDPATGSLRAVLHGRMVLTK